MPDYVLKYDVPKIKFQHGSDIEEEYHYRLANWSAMFYREPINHANVVKSW